MLLLHILQEQGLDYRDGRDGQFPSRSVGTPDARWMAQDSLKAYSELSHAGPKRHVIPILSVLFSEDDILIAFLGSEYQKKSYVTNSFYAYSPPFFP